MKMDYTQAKSQFEALGQYEYEIVKMRHAAGSTLYQADYRDWPDMLRKKTAYETAVFSGENLYLRPNPDAIHPIIFLDDVTPEASDFLKSQGIVPACIVETSRTDAGIPRLHCWYRLAKPTDRPTRKAIEYILIDRLHKAFPDPDPKKMPGDFGSNDGGHLGRLAGSWNHGLTKPRNCPVSLIEATGHILSPEVSASLLQEAKPYIDYSPKRIDRLDDIRGHQYDRPSIVSFFEKTVMPKMNPQRPHFQQDFFAACYLLKQGFTEMDIKKVLLEHSPNSVEERKAGHEAHYLGTTLHNALKAQSSPSPLGGGGGFDALRRESAAPSSVSQQAPAPSSEPEEETAYVGGGTGKKMRGMIDLATGKIEFGVAEVKPAPKPPVRKTTRPRLGVRPLAARRPASGPKP